MNVYLVYHCPFPTDFNGELIGVYSTPEAAGMRIAAYGCDPDSTYIKRATLDEDIPCDWNEA